MHAELNACMRKLLGACMQILGFGCMSITHLGACMRKRLGAKYADVGCMYAETLGCMPDCLCMQAAGCHGYDCFT